MHIAILLILSLSFLYLFSLINGLNIEIENLQAAVMGYQSEQLILQEKILNCLSNIQENLVQMEARRVDTLWSQQVKFYVLTFLVASCCVAMQLCYNNSVHLIRFRTEELNVALERQKLMSGIYGENYDMSDLYKLLEHVNTLDLKGMNVLLQNRKGTFYLHEQAVTSLLKNFEALDAKVNALILNPKTQEGLAAIAEAIVGSGFN